MAGTTISIACFTPQAFARPRTPKPNPKKRSRNPKPKFKPQRTSYKPAPQPVRQSDFCGGEATTYTRLRPVDDFVAPSVTSASQSSIEVKLSDSMVAKTSEINEKEKVEKEYDDLEKGEDDLLVDYGGFQVFEVNSDSEDVDEDYDYKNCKSFNYELEEGGGEEGDQNAGYVNLEHSGDLDVKDNYFNYMLEEGEGEEEDKNEKRMNFEDGDDLDVKEKGVPAIMRCFDRAKIYVKAGNGGNGVVAFRREKFVPLGGPSGGDGGRGGNVYVEVDESMNSLLPFRNQVHFRAGRGAHGQGMMMNGAKGEDVVVKVAPGTVIREADKEEVLLELLYPGQRALLVPGGRGGRGNAAFKCGSNKVPRIAENGEEGHEMWLELELKLVADVGIVGAPNAGKSTFLSVISAARPAIANYPFTTLLPNLGVVSFDYDSTMVVADLPGLLEGAHRGFGLGHEFLRHTERCLALVHVVDGSSEQPELEFDAVRLELEMFSPEIAEKPFVVAYNKMDLPEAYKKWLSFKESLQSRGIEVFCMSAATREGTHEVISAAYELLQENKAAKKEHEEWAEDLDLNHVADTIQKQRRSPINDFEITHDAQSNTWHVNGSGLQRFVQMTNWRYIDSERRFQHVLEACGVNKSLMKLGVKEGDTVIVGEMELVWHDSPDTSGSSSMKKQPNVSSKWPEWK